MIIIQEMSVAEARALEEAIQLSLTESSHRASRPTRQRDGSFNTEDFESGFTTMSASSNDVSKPMHQHNMRIFLYTKMQPIIAG